MDHARDSTRTQLHLVALTSATATAAAATAAAVPSSHVACNIDSRIVDCIGSCMKAIGEFLKSSSANSISLSYDGDSGEVDYRSVKLIHDSWMNLVNLMNDSEVAVSELHDLPEEYQMLVESYQAVCKYVMDLYRKQGIYQQLDVLQYKLDQNKDTHSWNTT